MVQSNLNLLLQQFWQWNSFLLTGLEEWNQMYIWQKTFCDLTAKYGLQNLYSYHIYKLPESKLYAIRFK